VKLLLQHMVWDWRLP